MIIDIDTEPTQSYTLEGKRVRDKADQTSQQIDQLTQQCDLSVFSSITAFGLNDLQLFGLYLFHVIPLLHMINKTGKVVGFNRAELNPKVYMDSPTAKWCAIFINYFLQANQHYYTRSA